jgi:uncharacterized membrane protein YwzB
MTWIVSWRFLFIATSFWYGAIIYRYNLKQNTRATRTTREVIVLKMMANLLSSFMVDFLPLDVFVAFLLANLNIITLCIFCNYF